MEKSHQLRQQRWRLLRNLEKFLDVPMMLLGIVWLVLLIIELSAGLPRWLEISSLVIWAIFSLDFILSFSIAPDKKIFLRRNLITIISLVVPAFRILRVLRVFRLLRGIRLLRLLTTLNRSLKILTGTMRRRGFAYVSVFTMLVIFAGAAGMYAFEKEEAAGFVSYTEALWWTAMMVITIGSDYWPASAEGRVLTFLIALYGFAVLGYLTAAIATFFIGQDDDRKPGSTTHDRLLKEIETLKDMLRKRDDAD